VPEPGRIGSQGELGSGRFVPTERPPNLPHPPGYEGRFDLAGWYLVRALVRLRSSLGRRTPSLIDLGMGRGRDLIYLARCGFRVFGVDIAPGGLQKAQRRAARLRVRVRTQLGDLRTYRLEGPFDVVFSSSSLNHLPPKLRRRRFAHFKAATSPGGLHAMNAFLPAPDRRPVVDLEPDSTPFRPGELRGYYSDWQILDSRRFEFECDFGTDRHHHALDVVIARKPA